MTVIFLLIPLSVVIATGFLLAFIWAVRSGQYEDTCTPSMRMLLQDLPRIGQGEDNEAPGTDRVSPASLAAPPETNRFPLTPKQTHP